jgi:hypothetical protein
VPLSGGAASVAIATFNDGAVGFEICSTPANCQAGVNGSTGGAFSSVGAAIDGLAVAPPGAPNGGNVLVADGANNRVQEFTAAGAFVRAFGWNTVASGPSGSGAVFKVCAAAALDICRGGETGDKVGQFSQGPQRIAEDSSGNIYTVEARANFRVQKFILPSNLVTPQGDFNPVELKGSKAPNAGLLADTPVDIAVDTASPPVTPGTVYVAKYVPGGTPTPAPPIDKQEVRVLKVDPSANAGTGAVTTSSAAHAQIAPGAVVALALNTTSQRTYLFQRPIPVFIIDDVPPIAISDVQATDIGASTATLRATITPSALPELTTLYHFEYRNEGSAEWIKAPVAAEVDIGNGTSPVAVSQPVSGLGFEDTYELKVVAHTKYNGAEATAAGPSFTTQPNPPVVTTGRAIWSSPAPTAPSLLLNGLINPGHDRTVYRFEYVNEDDFLASGFSEASFAPVAAAEAGGGIENVAVQRSISGLDPSQTYHYRLTASNSVDTAQGSVREISPPSPADRFYERVSDGDSWGSGVGGSVGSVAASGDRASFLALAFEKPGALPGPANPYVASRTDVGWRAVPLAPRVGRTNETAIAGLGHQMASDLGAALWSESSLSELQRAEMQLGISRLDGSHEVASQQLVPLARGGETSTYQIVGAAADLSTSVFVPYSGGVSLLSGEPLLQAERRNLYEVSDGELSIVNRANGKAGALIGGICGADLGANPSASQTNTRYRAISRDGATVYFSARPTAPAEGTCTNLNAYPKRLYKRLNNETTIQVSASQCTRVTPACVGVGDAAAGDDTYQGASVDGSVAFFTSTRQLIDTDTDTTADLYLYDASPPAGQPTLAQVSAGEVVPGSHPTIGSGAKALGVLDNSADGSRVYFVAEGRLTAAASAAVAAKNLYVYQRDESHPNGRIDFIGALDATADAAEWASTIGDKSSYALPLQGGAGDGHLLLFLTAAPLLAGDADTAKDLYRYDDTAAPAERLGCLTCAGDGDFGVATIIRGTGKSDSDAAERSTAASADLSMVVFTSREGLVSDDDNGLTDVYISRDGVLELISGATEGFGVEAGFRAAAISPDGNNVFFVTRAPLVASDSNNALDLYDARVGGGFPAAAEPEPCAEADQCRGPVVESPDAAPAAGGSDTFVGSGNQRQPPPCKKGKVRRRGKCVRKPGKHVRKHHKRAGHKRGGNR